MPVKQTITGCLNPVPNNDNLKSVIKEINKIKEIINSQHNQSGVLIVSIVDANGFTGSVANPTNTPSITLNTTINGMIKGNGSALLPAQANIDYLEPSYTGFDNRYASIGRMLTINGQAYSLLSDRIWTITTTGTTNRISVTGGNTLTPTIDIASTYIGQSSITTVGTLTSGSIGTGFTAIGDTWISSSSNWNTAFGWGNHALAGYFLASNFNSSFDSRLSTKTTTNLAEGTNLYYLDSRARLAISAGSGISYDNTTGIISSSDIDINLIAGTGISISGIFPNFTLSSTITQYTDTLARLAISSSITAITYTNTTGVFSLTSGYDIPTTTEIAAWNALTTMTYPSAGIPISTGTTWGISITDNSTDWNTAYTNRITSLTVTGNNGASTLISNVLNIPTYTLAGLSGQPLNNNLTSISGLSYASLAFVKMSASGTFTLDTNTYLTGNQTITLSGDVSGSGTTSIITTIGAGKVTNTMLVNPSFYIGTTSITLGRASLAQSLTGITSIDGSAATLTTGRTISGTGEATFTTGAFDGSAAVSGSVTLLNSAVTGKVLTGLNLSSGGTISATDSILSAFGRVQNQISALAGGVTYQGTWNANTNSPTITSSTGTKGYYYVVNVAGSTSIDGITDWKVGDWIIFNGSTWDKVDNTDAVSSVNGFTGAVSLTTANISEVTNLYYLDSRARAAISLTTTGNSGASSYSSSTGIINIPTYTLDGLSPMTTAGDLIYGGALGTATRLAIGGVNTVLHGGASAPSWSAVVEADISLSNNTTNNATTSRHGFLPILPNNATLYLNGQGNYTTPSGLSINNSYSQTAFSGTTVTVVHNWGAYPIVQVIDNTGAVIIPMSIVNNTLNDFTVTFSSSHTGTIIASLGGPQPQAVSVVTSNYAVLTTDRIVKVTTTGITVTLPTAVGNTGREYYINNTTSGNIFLTGTSSQTISGQLIQVIPSGSTAQVYSDGVGYYII